jgi:LysR family transcriptional regulator, nod-box dependent transcriptional activator
MDLHRFDLNLLVALDALLSERNVTKAGARLNLSQSAMSGMLARLRDHFQDALLVPVGRRMVLTPLAQDLEEPVHNLLLQVKGTLGAMPRFDPATANRHLSIAASDYVLAILLTEVLRDVHRHAPHISVELRPSGRQSMEQLENGELDFLIAPTAFVSAAHPKETLFEDTFTCIAWLGNELVDRTIGKEEYLNRGHVMVYLGLTPGSLTWDEQFLRRLNHRRRVEVWTPSFSSAPELVVGTDRIATIPTRLALKYADLLPLKLLPLPIEIPPVVQVLQWHTIHDADPGHRWIRGILKQAVSALPTTESISRQPPARPGRRRVPQGPGR